MSNQFYEPAPDDLVACDDGLHFILLDEANAHCNWVMRRHPGGGLVSVRKATEHELSHAKARQHLRAGAAQIKVGRMEMGDLNTFTVFAQRLREYNHNPHHINPMSEAFHKLIDDAADALAAQRDEGLAREAELRRRISALEGDGSWGEMALTVKVEALQQRRAEAEKLLQEISNWLVCEAIATPDDMAQSFTPFREAIDTFLARPGCADGENYACSNCNGTKRVHVDKGWTLPCSVCADGEKAE